MGDTAEEPQQKRPLDCPAHGDPLALELDRENQGDEQQRHAAEPRQATALRQVHAGEKAQHRDHGEQCWHGESGGDETGKFIREGALEQILNQQEMADARKCAGDPRCSLVGEGFPKRKGQTEEQRVKS